MGALNMSCKIKTCRLLQLPYFCSSYSIHLINKLRTAKKCNNRNGIIEQLRQEVSWFVELDERVLFENLSLQSTRFCFKF